MFYVEINNKKMKTSSGRVYKYDTYLNALNSKNLVYGSSYDDQVKIVYEDENYKIVDIKKIICDILKSLNSGKQLELPKHITIKDNLIMLFDNIILGRLSKTKIDYVLYMN